MILSGFFLVAVCLVGIRHGIKAALAQANYHRTKYREAARLSTSEADARCEVAHRLYPYNYHYVAWMAERAFYGGDGGADTDRVIAGKWCARGLKMNPYKAQFHLVHAYVLAERSPTEAARAWENYVDWDFWDPFNHAVLAELYASAGMLREAAAALFWVPDTPHYRWAREALREAWARELRQP